MSKFPKVSKADYYARIFSGHGPERLKKVLPFPGIAEAFDAICVRNLVWDAHRKTVWFQEVAHPLNAERTAVFQIEIGNPDIHRISTAFLEKTFGISKGESEAVRELALDDLKWLNEVGKPLDA